jgi:hypothetical protein
MNTIQKRFLLFLFGCIGVRLLFTYIAKITNKSFLPYLALIALIPVIGWLYIIFIGKRDTGAEVFGNTIWWKNLRPIHLMLYSIFAYLAIQKNTNAWLALLVDTLFGLSAFLTYHYSQNNFSKLL